MHKVVIFGFGVLLSMMYISVPRMWQCVPKFLGRVRASAGRCPDHTDPFMYLGMFMDNGGVLVKWNLCLYPTRHWNIAATEAKRHNSCWRTVRGAREKSQPLN